MINIKPYEQTNEFDIYLMMFDTETNYKPYQKQLYKDIVIKNLDFVYPEFPDGYPTNTNPNDLLNANLICRFALDVKHIHEELIKVEHLDSYILGYNPRKLKKNFVKYTGQYLLDCLKTFKLPSLDELNANNLYTMDANEDKTKIYDYNYRHEKYPNILPIILHQTGTILHKDEEAEWWLNWGQTHYNPFICINLYAILQALMELGLFKSAWDFITIQ